MLFKSLPSIFVVLHDEKFVNLFVCLFFDEFRFLFSMILIFCLRLNVFSLFSCWRTKTFCALISAGVSWFASIVDQEFDFGIVTNCVIACLCCLVKVYPKIALSLDIHLNTPLIIQRHLGLIHKLHKNIEYTVDLDDVDLQPKHICTWLEEAKVFCCFSIYD